VINLGSGRPGPALWQDSQHRITGGVVVIISNEFADISLQKTAKTVRSDRGDLFARRGSPAMLLPHQAVPRNGLHGLPRVLLCYFGETEG
jgi:hypothetical protein